MRRLDELQEAEKRAEREVLWAARMWRSYARDGKAHNKFARQWLKKLAEAEEARRAAQEAWSDEYAAELADRRAEEMALLAFEAEGGRLNSDLERYRQWSVDFHNTHFAPGASRSLQ